MAKLANANVLLGKLIKQRRKELKLSQEELAESAGLHRTYIGQLEQGKKSPTIRTLILISKTLKVKPSELIIQLEKADE